MYGFVGNNGVTAWDLLGMITGQTCEYEIIAGHLNQSVNDQWFKDREKTSMLPRPLDTQVYISCGRGLPKDHFNLWPTAESRDKYWNAVYTAEDQEVKYYNMAQAGDRKYPTAKANDPILGDILSKAILDAQKEIDKTCNKSTKQSKCNKVRLKVSLSNSKSMNVAIERDLRVKEASGYENTYDCEAKKWIKEKLYTGGGQ